MHHDRRSTSSNGTSTTDSTAAPVETEVVQNELQPTGQAYPMVHPIPQGHMLVRKEIAWAIGGAIVGGVFTAWLIKTLKK